MILQIYPHTYPHCPHSLSTIKYPDYPQDFVDEKPVASLLIFCILCYDNHAIIQNDAQEDGTMCFIEPTAVDLSHQERQADIVMDTLHFTQNIQTGLTIIPNTFIDQYMRKADGEYVKIYLMMLSLTNQGRYEGPDQLADLLELTHKDVMRALRYWEKVGLLQAETASPERHHADSSSSDPSAAGKESAADGYSSVQGSAADGYPSEQEPAADGHPSLQGPSITVTVKQTPARASMNPRELESTVKKNGLEQTLYMAETYMGRPLSQNELSSFVYMNQELGFAPDLIEYLLEYCVTRGKKSIRYMESVAVNWYQQNIDTVTKAKAESAAYTQNVFPVMKAFGISNRNPAPSEIAYIRRWNEMGYDADVLTEACNRTMLATHQASFPYATSILESWKKAGVRNRKDIEILDQNHRSRKAADKKTADQMNSNQKHSDRTAEKASSAGQRQRRTVGNPFHNFEQRTYDYDDLEARLQNIKQS